MKKMFALTLIAAMSLPAYGIRSGTSVVVSPSNMGINTNVISKRYGSIWNVWIGATTKLYKSNVGTACSIVKTGNTYSVKINAFSQSFSYIQSSTSELSLVKTETINVSKTVRRLVTFNATTDGNKASLTANVEVQTLVKGVWKTSIPSYTWLQSYTSISNMDTEV